MLIFCLQCYDAVDMWTGIWTVKSTGHVQVFEGNFRGPLANPGKSGKILLKCVVVYVLMTRWHC